MKYLIVLLLLLSPILSYGQADENHFFIKIEEWNSWNSNEYIFSDTTITIKRNCTVIDKYDCYQSGILGRQLKNIKEFLSETNLDSAKARYSNNYVDDMFEYNFTIVYNDKKNSKHIYMTEYAEYIKLVELLNEIIPDYFSIEYDYNYLHGKLRIHKK